MDVSGKQIGLTKSEKTAGSFNLRITNVLPSTGDFIIPTICRSCSQGEELLSLMFPSRATHTAFDCLKREAIKILHGKLAV